MLLLLLRNRLLRLVLLSVRWVKLLRRLLILLWLIRVVGMMGQVGMGLLLSLARGLLLSVGSHGF